MGGVMGERRSVVHRRVVEGLVGRVMGALLTFAAAFSLVGFAAVSARAAETERPIVYAGVHLQDIADIDLRDGSFEASFLLWARWAGPADATPPIEIVNADLREKTEALRESQDGWNVVRWQVRGLFRNRFSVAEFPFDRHPVEVRLRLDAAFGALEPDLAASGAEETFSAAGWLYEPYFEARRADLQLASDFGSARAEGAPKRLGELSFVLTMERPRLSIALRYLPLLIVVAVAAVALWTPPDRLEIASGLIVTSLLASIAFYFAEAGGLPDVPYLTRAHFVFLGAYLLILGALTIAFLTFFLRRWRGLANSLGHLTSIAILATAAWGSWWFLRPVAPAEAAPTAVEAVLEAALAAPAATDGEAGAAGAHEDSAAGERADIGAAPRPGSDRAEAVVSLAILGDKLPFAIYGAVLTRGAIGRGPDGEEQAHLLDVLPAATNDRVRFLPDGRMRVLWRLRPGLRWGDGTPIEAQDLLLGQRRKHGEAVRLSVLDPLSVEAIYDGRDQIYLEPTWILPHRIFEPIYAEGGWSAAFDRLRTDPPPLDGPYVLTRFEEGVAVEVARNPYFAGRRPILERIRFIATTGPESYISDLTSGARDLGYENSETTFARFEGADGLALERFARPTFYRLDLDLAAPGLDEPHVRRALAMAIDRAALSPDGVAPAAYRKPADADFAPGLTPPPYDPVAARRLLAEAGGPDGFPLKLLVRAQRLETGERVLIEQVEADLKAAGVAVERFVYGGEDGVTLPSPTGGAMFRLTTAGAGREGFLWGGLSYRVSTAERVERVRALFGEEAASLWSAFERSPYAPRRAAASRRLQALFVELQPSILLSSEARRTVRAESLQGWRPDAVSASRPFWNIEDWRFAAPDPEGSAADAPEQR